MADWTGVKRLRTCIHLIQSILLVAIRGALLNERIRLIRFSNKTSAHTFINERLDIEPSIDWSRAYFAFTKMWIGMCTLMRHFLKVARCIHRERNRIYTPMELPPVSLQQTTWIIAAHSSLQRNAESYQRPIFHVVPGTTRKAWELMPRELIFLRRFIDIVTPMNPFTFFFWPTVLHVVW